MPVKLPLHLRGLIEKIPDMRTRAIDGLLTGIRNPLFEDERTAILLYRGDVDGVGLIGDMTDWVDVLPFERVPGTDLFFHRGSYEPTARLEYLLQPAGTSAPTATFVPPGAQTPLGTPAPIADPLNPFGVYGFVLNSELAMPGYVRDPVFTPYLTGRKGGHESLVEWESPAGILPYPHRIHVYLPPGYHASSEEFPSAYFQDGLDYIEYGITPRLLDALIKGGEIPPLIAVFVTPPNFHQPEIPSRMTEYGMNDAYIEFFAGELVRETDARYRTRREPSARLVVGPSYGGLISVTIAFHRPEIFGMAYSQSGYLSFQEDRLIRDIAAAPRPGARFYADCGTYERRVARGIVPDQEGDFLQANRRFRDALMSKGADCVYREYPEGHTWGNWRAHLRDALVHFFGKPSNKRL